MPNFIVFYRRLDGPIDGKMIADGFKTKAEAEARALQINCKPFTPYFAWVEAA